MHYVLVQESLPGVSEVQVNLQSVWVPPGSPLGGGAYNASQAGPPAGGHEWLLLLSIENVSVFGL